MLLLAATALAAEFDVTDDASLDDALEAALAGDTLNLAAGTYDNPWELDTDLIIQGVGFPVVLIDSVGSGTTVRIINNAQVELRDLTIDGLGLIRSLRVDGGSGAILRSVVLQNGNTINSGGNLSISAGGTLDCGDCTLVSGTATGNGGNAYIWGEASFRDSRLSLGVADDGAGLGVSGVTTLIDTVLIDNIALSDGGGISVSGSGELSLNGCSVDTNSAAQDGGGIRIGDGGMATLQSSTIRDNASSTGGGIFAGAGSVLSIRGGSFRHNSASGAGGGVYSQGSLDLRSTLFHANTSGSYGAAVALGSGAGPATLQQTTFCDNAASTFAGAIAIGGAVPVEASNTLFFRNTAQADAGAVHLVGTASWTGSNNTWAENSGFDGGAIAVDDAASATETGSLFVANDGGSGVAIQSFTGGTTSLIDNLFYLNTPQDTDWQDNTGALYADPLFAEPSPPPDQCRRSDFWLTPGSPAIDSAPGLDPDGSPADRGAHGGSDADDAPFNDDDADGSPAYLDCAPDDATVYPGAPEVPDNSIDEDCDGSDLISPPVDTAAPPDTGLPADTAVPPDTDLPPDTEAPRDTGSIPPIEVDIGAGCEGCSSGNHPVSTGFFMLGLLALGLRRRKS